MAITLQEKVKFNVETLDGTIAQVQKELDDKMDAYKKAQWERGDITSDEYKLYLNGRIPNVTDLQKKANLEDDLFTVKEDVENTKVYNLYKEGMIGKDAYLKSQETRLGKYQVGSAMYNKIQRDIGDLREEVRSDRIEMNDSLKDSEYESGAINDVQYTDYLRGRATEEAGRGNTLTAFEFNDKARTVEWTAENIKAQTDVLKGVKSPFEILDIMKKQAGEYVPGSTAYNTAMNAYYKYAQDTMNTINTEEANTLSARLEAGEITPEQYRLGMTRMIAQKENRNLEQKVAAERQVDDWYQQQFGRLPDSSGRTMWANRILAGESLESLKSEIARSEEAINRAQGITSTGLPANLPQDYGYGYPGGQTAWYAEHTKSIQNEARNILNRELSASEVQKYATSEADISKIRLDLQKIAQGGQSGYGVILGQTPTTPAPVTPPTTPSPTPVPTVQQQPTGQGYVSYTGQGGAGGTPIKGTLQTGTPAPITNIPITPSSTTITPANAPTPSNKTTITPSALDKQIGGWYQMYLGRQASSSEIADWAKVGSAEKIQQGIMGSEEAIKYSRR